MTDAAPLAKAQGLAAPLPALLARAQALADTVATGGHGRRRAGMGEAFWQYRPALAGDSRRAIDWRRSASRDEEYVREVEAEHAQTILLWADSAASMQFASQGDSKATRAQVLGLALAAVLLKGGERVGLADGSAPARGGPSHIHRLSFAITQQDTTAGYGHPKATLLPPKGQAVFLSDFLGDLTATEAALTLARTRRVGGALVMVLDPAEEDFPFVGRTLFESMCGALSYDAHQAGALQTAYRRALLGRVQTLRHWAKAAGWVFHLHRTDHAAQDMLLRLYTTMQGQGGR